MEHAMFIGPPSSEGKSVLDVLLRLQGIPFIAGPVHTDGPDDFAAATLSAHDVESCLPSLHDAVLEATGQSLSHDDLRTLLTTLPPEIIEQIDEWGLADTEVREQIYAHLQKRSI